jgi:hypothetical protein
VLFRSDIVTEAVAVIPILPFAVVGALNNAVGVVIYPDPGLDIPEDLMGKPEEIKRYIDENKHKAGRNKSNLLYDASKAYLDGLGFRTRFKPNAWASSVAADFHVRGAKKRIRKSRKKRLIESE